MTTHDVAAVDEAELDEPAGPEDRGLGIFLVVGGAIAFVAAVTLLLERLHMLRDPSYVPSCSINPIISCGSVMTSEQASVFGFPNPIMGVAGFAGLVVVGAGILAGGVFRRWYWLGVQAGVTFGAVFIHWLIFQSLYRIGALCPYCMVAWTVMIPLFLYVTRRNLRDGVLPAPARLRDFVVDYHAVILTSWYLLILALVTVEFWSYWSTLLP